MKKSTKILSLILSVLTLLSVFSAATPVFAEEVTEATSENAEIVDNITVSSEETETEENAEAEIVSEIEDMRTEYTKYFRMSDGSYMAAQYAQPVHYEENGEWKEYDYSITENENTDEAEKFVIENSDSEMSFPEEFLEDNEAQIEVSAREYDIKFSPVIEKKLFNKNSKGKVKDHKKLKSNEIIEEFTEEAPIDESADKNAEKLKIDNQKSAIAYEEVYDNIDLEYEISSNQIKESMVETEKLDNATYKYYYDSVGNITKIDKNSGAYRSYTYDKKNQLLSEVNSTNGITTNFTYDAIGNITKKVESSANGTKTINYRYGNDGKTGWNNLLIGVDFSGNGAYESTETISYDAIGNPTTYLGASLSWYGRQLKNYTKGSASVSYTYDSDGLRGTKIYNGTKSTYHYVSGQLRYETRGDLKFYYFYDANGNLSAIRYYDANDKSYAYFALTNAQGDVVAFYTGAGVCVVTYEYDAWGNVVKTTDTTGINFAELNPIRYRGYYYDSETGLYYLQSRYYNPQVGRFLNSDSISDQSAGILGYNSYIYASNNPVNYSDPSGHSIICAILVGALCGAVASGVSEFVSEMIKKKGDINKDSWKKIGRSALIGGVCGAVSGGIGGVVSSYGVSRVAQTATEIVLDGFSNLAETIWNEGPNVTFSECATSFVVGVATSGVGAFCAKGVQKLNAKVFDGISNSTKKAMLNSNNYGQKYTTEMVRNKAYLNDDAYYDCISYQTELASNSVSTVSTIFVNIFQGENE